MVEWRENVVFTLKPHFLTKCGQKETVAVICSAAASYRV